MTYSLREALGVGRPAVFLVRHGEIVQLNPQLWRSLPGVDLDPNTSRVDAQIQRILRP